MFLHAPCILNKEAHCLACAPGIENNIGRVSRAVCSDLQHAELPAAARAGSSATATSGCCTAMTVGRRCSNHSLLPSAAASNIQLLPAKDLSAAAAARAGSPHSPAADFLLLILLQTACFSRRAWHERCRDSTPTCPTSFAVCTAIACYQDVQLRGQHLYSMLQRPMLLAPSTHLAAGRGAASHMLLGHCLSLRLMTSMSVRPACACQVWVPTISQLVSELSARAQSCPCCIPHHLKALTPSTPLDRRQVLGVRLWGRPGVRRHAALRAMQLERSPRCLCIWILVLLTRRRLKAVEFGRLSAQNW